VIESVGIAVAALVVGGAVGATGVGGVLLVPALWAALDMPLRAAMGTVLVSNAANGVLASLLFHRRGSIAWDIAVPLCGGAAVSAFAGGVVNAMLPATFLLLLLGAVLIAGSAAVLWRAVAVTALGSRPTAGRAVLLAVIGLVSGLVGGLTGAGGPIVSVPLMTICGFPFLGTVAASQVMQIVASVSGAAAYATDGSIAFAILGWFVPLQLAGIWIGVRIAHVIDVVVARRVIAGIGIAVGALLIALA
jgi:uncharacterized membrane protein YfcA